LEEIRNFQPFPYSGYDEETILELVELEEVYSTNPYYLEAENGSQIRWDMRAILVDWMTEVAQDYHLKISTLHMAVNFLDRYSQKAASWLKKNMYQLVGLTCIILATKIEVNFKKLKKNF
jgi:G2/mitotic-specific cyclin 3/4